MSLTLMGAGPATSAPPAFVPTSISGLQVWLKDTGLAGADGTAVTTWTDSSGQGHNFASAVANEKPVKKTSILNGHDVARFDGGDFVTSADLSAVFPSAATLFIVCAGMPASSTYHLYDTRMGDGFWSFSAVGYWDSFRSARVNTYPTAIPTSGNHYFAVRSSAVDYKAWIDGVAQAVKTAAYAAGTTHRLGYGTGGYVGDVAEVLVYDTALSDANMLAVHTYLAARFGL